MALKMAVAPSRGKARAWTRTPAGYGRAFSEESRRGRFAASALASSRRYSVSRRRLQPSADQLMDDLMWSRKTH
jgi:hypothetical protein